MMYEKEILSIAIRFHIPSNWIKAIITQESHFDPYSIRYEPEYDYFYKVDEIAQHQNVSFETEKQCQKISWGLGQIMGALAREQGLNGPMGSLFEPLINISHIGMRLYHLKMIYSQSEDDIFAMYNGGPGARMQKDGKYRNQSYVDSVKKHLLDLSRQ